MHTILLTGFKPFGYHNVNESESCVGLIKESGLEAELDVKLVTEILEVSYETCHDRVSSLWKEHNPFLVIHLGVHGKEAIVVEKCARKTGYKSKDVRGNCLESETCPAGEKEVIFTGLDVSNVCKLSQGYYCVQSSENAGLYLCEYVYYLSLSHDPSRTLFIHVPPFEEFVSPKKKAMIIREIIKEMFLQLKNNTENEISSVM